MNYQNENEAYLLWVGDTIDVKFFNNEKLNDEVIIRPDGKISLQLIGEVKAAGFTPAQLDDLLTQEYSKFLYANNIPATCSTSSQLDSLAALDVSGSYGNWSAPYILSVGSTIGIKSFYNKQLNDEVTIRPDGKISLQLIGEVNAAGLKPTQLESLLARKYSKVLYAGDVATDHQISTQQDSSTPLPQYSESSYILSIRDKIAINFSYNEELNQEVTIRPDGVISLERIGEVKAAGLTPAKLDSLLTREYSKVLYVDEVTEAAREGNQLDALDLLSESHYILSVGNIIAIKFFYNDDLNEDVIIRPDGKISLQRIGEVKAAGLTPTQLDSLLTEKYSKFLKSPEVAVIVRNPKLAELTIDVKDFMLPLVTVVVKDFKLPEVSIAVKKSAAQKVYIGGEIARPGMIPITGMLRVLDAVIQAGGASGTAELEYVILIRYNTSGQPDVHLLNLNQIMRGQSPDVILRPYDVVYLPRTAIAEVSLLAKQYIHNLIPIQFTTIYNLNPETEIK
ncbi:MAG: polysaccharide biosynthesis/export family protein [Planctomycetota bacterium]